MEQEPSTKEKRAIDVIMAFVIAVLVLSVVIFGGIEAYTLWSAYHNADKVKCNWLWCVFTTERTNITQRITQDCRVNGVPVDCATITDNDNATGFGNPWFNQE